LKKTYRSSVSDVSSKQRSVIDFLLEENESITNIHRRLTNVYGYMAVDKSTVSRWAKRLTSPEQAQGNVSDLPGSGRPSTVVLPRSQTINSEVCVETLMKRFRRVRPHKDETKVLLHHDSARPHTSLHTREAIAKLQWTVLPHPPYSPNMAPCDYHLFNPLKDAIRGKKFQEDEVISEVRR
jgi:hypothetical protein